MTTLVVALVLGSAVAHASWNALLKGKRGEPLAASAGLSVAWVVFGAPLLFVVDAPAPAAWPYLAASVAVHVVYFSLLIAAYRVADLSLVYPIARGTPPLLVACAGWLFVGEVPSPLGIAGVVMIGLGVLGLGLVRVKPVEGKPSRGRGIALAFATAGFIASYTLIDGLGVRLSGSPMGYVVWLTAVQGAIFAVGALTYGGPSIRREVWARRKEGALVGILSAGGYAVALWAMTLSPIAYIAALRETSVVFAAVLGAVFLKESFGRLRVVAAIVVAAGVIAIHLGGPS
ncbi:MAG: EamA family transporter [Sandaracinaceae bacterium]|nr:EamA family transporter [Sandaracinaceae bacterium]